MLKSISLSGSRFDSTKMYVIATCQDEYIFDFTQSSHHIHVKKQKNIDLTLHSKRLSNMQLIAAQSVDFILNFSAMSLWIIRIWLSIIIYNHLSSSIIIKCKWSIIFITIFFPRPGLFQCRKQRDEVGEPQHWLQPRDVGKPIVTGDSLQFHVVTFTGTVRWYCTHYIIYNAVIINICEYIYMYFFT